MTVLVAERDGSSASIKKRGQNSALFASEVFDYLVSKYPSKAHAIWRERFALLMDTNEVVEVSKA